MGRYTNLSNKQEDKFLKRMFDCIPPNIKDHNMYFYVIDYLNDLTKKYKGIQFTRNNFEKFRGVESDTVKRLFKNKDSVSIEEIFLDKFMNKINRLDFAKVDTQKDLLNNEICTAGFHDAVEKTIVSNGQQAQKPNIAEPSYEGLTKEEQQILKKQYDSYIAQLYAKNIKYIDADNKYVLYHELNHLLDSDTYTIGENIFSKKVYYKSATEFAKTVVSTDNLVSPVLEEGIKDDVSKEEIALIGYRIKGDRALMETKNDVFSSKLAETFVVGENTKDKYMPYNQKMAVQSNTVYNKDYDTYVLLQIALRDKNISPQDERFNNKKIIEEVNSLKMSEDAVSAFKENVCTELASNSNKQTVKYETLKDCTNYQLISFALGVAQEAYTKGFVKTYESGKKQDLSVYYKSELQALLVNIIKNNYQSKLQDPNIVKDELFFEQMEKDMIVIDNLMYYENFSSKVIGSNNEETIIDSKYIYSIKNLHLRDPKARNVAEFSELVDVYEDACGKFNKRSKFLSNQQNLDSMYNLYRERRINKEKETNKAQTHKFIENENSKEQLTGVERLK